MLQRKTLKRLFYHSAKMLGLFALSRKLTRNKLRVLCYHGVSLDNEHEVFDKLFITPDLLDQRMAYLKEQKYTVLPLEQAVERMYDGQIQNCETVITFDDGWNGMSRYATDIIAKYNFPWTLYVTSYYMQKQTQVFNIVFQYMLHKTLKNTVSVKTLPEPLSQPYNLSSEEAKQHFYDEIMAYANSLNAGQRQEMLSILADALTVDIDPILQKECFKNISETECQDIADKGVDIQLHTHRHTFPPEDLNKSEQEIIENKQILDGLLERDLRHFCYPSGVHAPSQYSVMEKLGIRSATTVEPGLNDAMTHKYELRRFLDGENISQIEFEAELAGFSEILRSLRH